MNYGNGFFYLAEIGYFRLAQNGRFRPALTEVNKFRNELFFLYCTLNIY